MTTFILTWNPRQWKIAEEEYRAQVEDSERGQTRPDTWSVGNRT